MKYQVDELRSEYSSFIVTADSPEEAEEVIAKMNDKKIIELLDYDLAKYYKVKEIKDNE